jgi:integrase/recombinase XerD
MTFDAAQAAYAEDLGRRGLSPHTLSRYKNEVEQILRFLRGQGLTYLEEVGREHVQAFRDHLYFLKSRAHRAPLTAASQRLILTQVIIFFRHFLRQKVLTRNPAVSLILPRQEIKISRNYLRVDEMERLFAAVDTHTLFGLSDRTVFEVAYASGLRVNELLSAEVSDFKAVDRLLLVKHAKGGEERVVPLTPIACHFLAFWLRGPRVAYLAGRDSALLFPSESGRQQSLIYYRKRFRTYGLLADIPQRVSFHVFRRSAATHLLQNGADLRHIQRLLGHHSIDTTLRYLQTSTRDLREVLVRHHPREKWWRQRHSRSSVEVQRV